MNYIKVYGLFSKDIDFLVCPFLWAFIVHEIINLYMFECYTVSYSSH